MDLTATELYEIIQSIGVDSIPSINELTNNNLKTLFTSIEFISLIVTLEDRFNILLPKEMLEAEIVNFNLLRNFISDAL